MRLLLPTAALLLIASGAPASAQTVSEPRGILFADAGYARTADDEGMLGSGAGMAVGVGYRVTPRLTLQATFHRIPYYRDVEWLTFDGRVLFMGAEAAFQGRQPTVRPFVTIGAGVMNDDRIWLHKTQVGPGQSRIIDRTEHRYTLSMLTASGGLDIRLSHRASIRTSLRFHGLLDTGDDLAPHTILQPAIGMAWRW